MVWLLSTYQVITLSKLLDCVVRCAKDDRSSEIYAAKIVSSMANNSTSIWQVADKQSTKGEATPKKVSKLEKQRKEATY